MPNRINVNPDETGGQRPVCPYCGHSGFQNSWGEGNAMCVRCGNEFIVRVQNGIVKGIKIPKSEEEENES